MAHAQWGVVVRSLDRRERLYERNPHKLMMPASNMKIVTTAAAAHVLGWDARFTTTLETAAEVRDGVLLGDLIVRGSGDPTINARDGRAAAVFDGWVEALARAGIREIRGRLVGDGQLFDEARLGAGWAWDDLQYGYSAPVGALQFNENVAELTVTPGPAPGVRAFVHLTPGSGLAVVNRTVTTQAGVPETIRFTRRLDAPVLDVTGTVPLPLQEIDGERVLERSVVRQVAVPNPTLYFVRAVEHALEAGGIHVSGDAVDLDELDPPSLPDPPSARRVLARAESPPLRDIAVVLMKVSQNLYAESMLKAAGAATGEIGSTATGRAAVAAALREWGIDDRELVMADGSGLSRYNYLTPNLVASILERMHADAVHREAFTRTLPVAGSDGTLSHRMRSTPAQENVRAKTGTLSNVRALSGFVRTRDGEMLVFSIIANNFAIPGPTVTWVIDLAVEVLANFTREH